MELSARELFERKQRLAKKRKGLLDELGALRLSLIQNDEEPDHFVKAYGEPGRVSKSEYHGLFSSKGFTMAGVEKVRMVFNKFDADGDSCLNFTEFRGYLSALDRLSLFDPSAIETTEAFQAYMHDMYDTSNGLLTFGGFLAYRHATEYETNLVDDLVVLGFSPVSEQNRCTHQEAMRKFDFLDPGGLGKLSMEDYQLLLYSVGLTVTKHEVRGRYRSSSSSSSSCSSSSSSSSSSDSESNDERGGRSTRSTRSSRVTSRVPPSARCLRQRSTPNPKANRDRPSRSNKSTNKRRAAAPIARPPATPAQRPRRPGQSSTSHCNHCSHLRDDAGAERSECSECGECSAACGEGQSERSPTCVGAVEAMATGPFGTFFNGNGGEGAEGGDGDEGVEGGGSDADGDSDTGDGAVGGAGGHTDDGDGDAGSSGAGGGACGHMARVAAEVEAEVEADVVAGACAPPRPPPVPRR
jgi:Ca2+-binding EF-hand superfamily protein